MPDSSAGSVEPVLRAVRDAFAAAAALRRGRHPCRASSSRCPAAATRWRSSTPSRVSRRNFPSRSPPRTSITACRRTPTPGRRSAPSECAARNVPLAVHRVRIARAGGESLEATARTARYAALATIDADVIALAHHADDQAETLLLQLLRGAGPAGLAAMPRAPVAGRRDRRCCGRCSRCRAPRSTPTRKRCGLAWVDDESNADTGVKRNFIRHDIAPRLAAAFPGYPATLARAAAHQAEAARLADDLARLDARECARRPTPIAGMTLDRGRADRACSAARRTAHAICCAGSCASTGFARRRRRALRRCSTSSCSAAPDARVRLAHAGAEIGFYRGRIVVHAPAVAPFADRVARRARARASARHARIHAVHGRRRSPARRSKRTPSPCARAPAASAFGSRTTGRARALKRLLQDAGMPPWQRESLPLVFCGDALAAVPGIGVDLAFQAATARPGTRCTGIAASQA